MLCRRFSISLSLIWTIQMFLFYVQAATERRSEGNIKKMMNWVKLGLKDLNWNYFLIATFIKYLYPSHGKYLFEKPSYYNNLKLINNIFEWSSFLSWTGLKWSDFFFLCWSNLFLLIFQNLVQGFLCQWTGLDYDPWRKIGE